MEVDSTHIARSMRTMMGGAGTHHDRIDVHYLDKVLPSTFGNSDHQLRVTCWMNQ